MTPSPTWLANSLGANFTRGQICLLCCHPAQISVGDLELWYSQLTDEERSRAMEFRYYADYVSYIVAHALLRQSVSAIAGVTPNCVRFERAQNGKPELLQDSVAIPIRFNLSHTEGMIMVVLARDVEVGVDVERLDRKFAPEIVEYLCSADEMQDISLLSTQRQSVAYIELWTLKEALVKASGQGLTVRMNEICCALNLPRLLRSGPLPEDPTAWSVWRGHLAGGFAWSVAARTPNAELTFIGAF